MMEDKGGTAAAVIQGRRDAGLTVTLIGRVQSRCANNTSLLPTPNTVMKTRNTGTKSIMQNTGAQICDDRYISSYQMSHCNATPSSPPVLTTEFPIQNKLNRTHGNFNINECGNFQSPYYTMSFTRSRQISPHRDADEFVKSLRQYPVVPVEDNLSSELIQRMVIYSQTKNFSKSSCNTKSIRHLRSRNLKRQSGLKQRDQNISKSVQTYTRAYNKAKERDVDVEMRRRKQSWFVSRIPQKPEDLKNDYIDAMYDYLNASPEAGSGPTRPAEVRYLSDITRCVKNKFDHIFNLRHEGSANTAEKHNSSKYDQHSCTVSIKSDLETNKIGTQASATMAASTGALTQASKAQYNHNLEASTETYQLLKFCCKHRILCKSNPRVSTQTEMFSYVSENSSSESSCSSCDGKCIDDFRSKIKREVFIWLNEIPVPANDKPKHIDQREKLANSLIDKLNIVKHDQDFEENAENEILECLKIMPMWQPSNKDDNQAFKAHIVETLLNKIRDIVNNNNHNAIKLIVDNIPFACHNCSGQGCNKGNLKKQLLDQLKGLAQRTSPISKSEVMDILKEYPINMKENKSAYLNDLAEVLTEKIQCISLDITQPDIVEKKEKFELMIFDWLQGIPNINTTRFKDIIKLIPPLAKKVIHLQKHGIDDIAIQKKIIDVIIDWTKDNVETNLDPLTLHKLASELLDSLFDLNNNQNNNLLISETVEWFKKHHPTLGKDLVKSLHNVKTHGDSSSMTEIKVLNCLNNFLEKHNKNLDVDEKILNEMKHKVRNLLNNKKMSSCRKLFNEVCDCLENSTQTSSYVNTTENKEIVKQSVQKIEEILIENENLSDNVIEDKLSKLVTKLCDKYNNTMSTKEKTTVTKKLAEILKPEIVDKGHSRKFDKNAILKQVNDTLNDLELTQDPHTHISKEIESDIALLLLESIGEQKINDKKYATKKIADFLKKNTDIELNQINEIAKKIVSRIYLMYTPEHSDTSLVANLQESLKNDVHVLLNNSSIQPKYRDEIELTICNLLADQIMRNDASRMAENEIMTVLNRVLIPNEESKKLINELVNKRNNISFKIKTKAVAPTFNEEQHRKLIDNMYRNILEFTQQIKGDSNNMSMTNWKSSAQKLAEVFVNVKLYSKYSLDEKIHLRNEILQYFQKVNIYSDDNVNKLINLLQQSSFKTSTPRSSRDNGFSFDSEQNPQYSNMYSTIRDNSSIYLKKSNTTSEDTYRHQLADTINNWLHSLPIDLASEEINSFKNAMIKDLVEEIVEHHKYLQFNNRAQTSDEEEFEYLKYQVFRLLNKSPHITQLVTSKINELMKHIKDLPVPQLVKFKKKYKVTQTLNNNIDVHPKIESTIESLLRQVVNNWVRDLPFKIGQSSDNIKKDVDAFTTITKEIIDIPILNNLNKVKADLEEQIQKFLEGLPILKNLSHQNLVLDLSSKILELINTNLDQDTNLTNEVSTESLTKISSNNCYEDIKNWCDKLPISYSKTINAKEHNKILRQNIISKIMNTIAKLNMNPEIFNDTNLYLDLIRDEIDDVLNGLPKSIELENNRTVLKEMLIEIVKHAKQETENYLAGYTYKQKLQEIITKTLPSTQNFSVEERVPFEILKEKLADAFINLNYSEHDEYLINKFKDQLTNEISKYCNDYLKRYPAKPINPIMLKQELYSALLKVPAPKNDTIKLQVEQSRIKSKIYDWLKTLSLKDESPTEQLQNSKIITMLANDLNQLTKARLINDNDNLYNKMKQNVKKWVKKLSVQPETENVIDNLSENLIRELTSSQDKLKKYVNPEKKSADKAIPCQTDSDVPYSSNKDNLSKYIPSSILNCEDRQHLEKIKRRSHTPSLQYSHLKSKNAVSIPEEDSNQTNYKQYSPFYTNDSETNEQLELSKKEPISPNIVINKYNWDSTEESIPQGEEDEQRLQTYFQEENQKSMIGSSHNTTHPASNCNLLPQSNQIVPKPHIIPHDKVETMPSQTHTEPSHSKSAYQTLPQINSTTTCTPYINNEKSHKTNKSRRITVESRTLPKAPNKFKSRIPSSYKFNFMPHPTQFVPKPFSPHEVVKSTPAQSYNDSLHFKSPHESLPQMNHDSPASQTTHPLIRKTDSYVSPQPEAKRPDLETMLQTRISQTNTSVSGMSYTLPNTPNQTERPNMGTRSPVDDRPHVNKSAATDIYCRMKNCGNQCPKCKKLNGLIDEDWTMRFPKHTDLWDSSNPSIGNSCRMCIPSANHKDIAEKAIKRKNYLCNERVLSKCRSKASRETTQNHTKNSMQQCPKCCGVRYCPHPNYLYFK
ncbi:hypothetical protein ACJJTC_011033 [Scirpophaga incertulas]